MWSEPHPTRSAALQRERQIKQMKSSRWIRETLLNGRVPTSVVSHKRLELFSLIFPHSGASATGPDSLQGLFATVQFLNN